jgi:non-heme chloroperoxidase
MHAIRQVATIVFIHGMWAGPWVWEKFVPIFTARGHRCITPTLRHHDAPPDRPPAALGRTSLLDYVDDVERELDRLDEKPVLVGHSMGGIIAQILASRGRARAIVLLSPMPPQGMNVLSRASLSMFRETLKRWGFWKSPSRPTFRDASMAMLNRLPPEEQAAVYERLVHESGRAGCETGFWFVDPHRAKYVDDARVTCPVLVVAGSDDALHPPRMMRATAARYGDRATYLELTGHGHWLIGEPGWREVAERIADWIERAVAKDERARAPETAASTW